MKKFLLLISFLFLVGMIDSCQEESRKDLLYIAQIQPLADVINTKSSETEYTVTKEMVKSYIESCSKRQEILSIEGYPSEESPSMYVVNFEEGWAIFPTDSRFGITLADNPCENLDINDKSHNLGFQLLIEDYHEQIEHFRGRPMGDYDESSVQFWNHFRPRLRSDKKDISTVSNKNVTRDGMPWVIVEAGSSTEDSVMVERWHLLGAEWGQEDPWNVKMPLVGSQHCVTGCAPLAVAQVLDFFNVWSNNPSGLYHSISIANSQTVSSNPNYDYLQLTLSRNNYTASSPRWSQMPYSVPYGTTTGFEYASDLILDVGVRLGTVYGLCGSGTPINPSNNFFDLSPANISYSWGTYSSQLADTVITNIINRKPVIITAAKSSSYTSRHTWVIDGVYMYRTYYQNDFELWPVSMIPEGATIVDIIPESQLALLYPNYYPGMVYHVRDGYIDFAKFGMNFGDNGSHKWDFYSVLPNSSWEGYDIIKAIHYSLSPGDLLIQ